LHTRTQTVAPSPISASATPTDDDLLGAEITFGTTVIGRVEGLVRDPLSQRVWRLATSYGPTHRHVAVPIEWVIRRTPHRVELGVGTLSLDDLGDRRPTSN
jgi:hypothetical protein